MARLDDKARAILAAEPEGLGASELRRRLKARVSQPTLWRVLHRLRCAGEIVVEGRARATRYHLSRPSAVNVLRSRALHRSIAQKLAHRPELRAVGRSRLALLRTINPAGRPYHDAWLALLEGPLPKLLRTLNETSEHADVLRKESPLTTLLSPAERDRAFRSVRP
jgi:hypothetical protein